MSMISEKGGEEWKGLAWFAGEDKGREKKPFCSLFFMVLYFSREMVDRSGRCEGGGVREGWR